MSDLTGQTISDGRFLIEREIGRGGAGVVFEAVDVLLKRHVAIKTITSQGKSNNSNKRFEREVRSLAAVKSPYVPEIYHWGTTNEGVPFIVMERLSYPTLEETLLDSQTTLTNDDICAIAIEITKALSIIHDAGIVHRDLKPSNVMIHFDEKTGWSVKLLDFGLVHLLAPDQGLTATENTPGSIGYFSPEHATPQQIDCRSDIFSLGCMLFRATTGKPPFEAENLFASVLLMNSDTAIAIPSEIPQYLSQIIAKCLQAIPDKRFQSALELRQALESKTLIAAPPAASRYKPGSAKPALLIASVLAIAGLCFVLVGLPNKGNGARFTPEKTLSQAVADAAVSNNFSAQRILLKEVEANTEFLSRATPNNRKNLIEIAASQFKNGDIESGELAFDCVFKSLASRKAPPDQWIDTFNAESASYCAVCSPRPRAMAHGEQAVTLSIEAGLLPLQRRSYYLLALLHRLRNEIGTSLSYLKKAHKISTDQICPDENLDAEIAIKYAEVLILTGDQTHAIPLLSNAADELGQSLVRRRNFEYDYFSDLARAITSLKNSPEKKQLSKKVWLLLKNASAVFPSSESKIQTDINAAVLRLNYDEAGAKSDLNAILKSAEQNEKWTYFFDTVWILAKNRALSAKEFNCQMEKGLRKCHAEGNTSPSVLFTATSRAARLSAKLGTVGDALKFYSSAVDEAKRYIPKKGDTEGEFAKIKGLIAAADYSLEHGRADIASRAFEQLPARMPPSLRVQFEKVRTRIK